MADDDRLVVRDIELPAPTDEVWAALTEPGRVEAWFGARVTWDLRPGGAAEFSDLDDGEPTTGGDEQGRGAERPDADRRRAGEIDEVSPGRVLRFRWWPVSDHAADGDDEGGVRAVRYDLVPVPGGTRLTVTETMLTSPAVTRAAPPGASASMSAGSAWAGAISAWDVRLVALWLGCRPGLLVRA